MNRPRHWIIPLALTVVALSVPAFAGRADEVVDRMIAAHGGMDAWENAPSVSFTDAWLLPGMDAPMTSNVIVEQGSRRALLEVPMMNSSVGWDGEKTWSVNWASPAPPRFMVALTYYFVNLPWLARDPGVILGEPGRMKLWQDDTTFITIRMTYEAGVGDTPDDYYVLFIHPETYRLHGCVYVVTYPGLIPEGKKSTPEHVLIFESFDTVNGLLAPTSFTIYEHQEFYASAKITNWSFEKPFDDAMVAMPEGAVVDTSLD